MLKYLGVKCLNVYKLLSNGPAEKKKFKYMQGLREEDREKDLMWQVLTGESR